jgi:hypothetical protein
MNIYVCEKCQFPITPTAVSLEINHIDAMIRVFWLGLHLRFFLELSKVDCNSSWVYYVVEEDCDDIE